MSTKEHKIKSLIEQLADIEHQRWADWQKYCHSKMVRYTEDRWSIDDEFIQRWNRQINTPYSDLSEQEKQSDRDQVMRYWPLILTLIDQVETEVRREEREKLERAIIMASLNPAQSLIIHNHLKTNG